MRNQEHPKIKDLRETYNRINEALKALENGKEQADSVWETFFDNEADSEMGCWDETVENLQNMLGALKWLLDNPEEAEEYL